MFTFHSVSVTEVNKLLKALKANKATGPDGLPNKFIKIASDTIAYPLSSLYNSCLMSGLIPTAWKTAIVTPVFKSGDKTKVENYRPISLLSNISKVFERLVVNQLQSFSTDNNIIDDRQHGFRPNFSTRTAVVSLTDSVFNAMSRNEVSLLVLLDFSKAFDIISHDILLAKLYHYGSRGIELNLIHNYLTNRLFLL